MTDPHHAGDHHGPSLFQAYMIIAVALSLFTATSFFFNWLAHEDVKVIGRHTSFVLILGVAIIKATLVAMYFMHLKWDWSLLYYLIIPAFILGTMMMVVLMPDILLGPSREAAEEIQIAREYP
jgi:caa(3)-type oxidase subunit IV